SDERCNRAGQRVKADFVEYRASDFVREIDIFETDESVDVLQRDGAIRVFIFGALAEDFAGAIESGDGFSKLRADANDLDDGRDQKNQEHVIGEESADCEFSREDLVRANIHVDGSDHSDHHARRKRHERGERQGANDVIEQALHTSAENFLLALFCVIALDDADSAERFGEASGDFGVDLAPIPKDGANSSEKFLQKDDGDEHEADADHGHLGAEAHHDEENDDGGDDSSDEIDESRANKVSNAFNVGHDARDEASALIGIVISDGQAADVREDLVAKFGDKPLRGLGKRLSQ